MQSRASERKWEQDKDVTVCSGCGKTFSVSIRKVSHALIGMCTYSVYRDTHTYKGGIVVSIVFQNVISCVSLWGTPINQQDVVINIILCIVRSPCALMGSWYIYI